MASTDTRKKTTSDHPGWLLVMPDGFVHSWYAFQSSTPRRRSTAAEAMRRFEPNATRRKEKLRTGWTIRIGAPTTVGSTITRERATA